MRIHHLNFGTLCPIACGLLGDDVGALSRGVWPCHGLLLETQRSGLVLLDTGFGHDDCTTGRLPRMARLLLAPRLDTAETAIAQVRALGFDPRDVRHVVVTHLDLDHAGGLADFPWARVHLHALEHEASRCETRFEKTRLFPDQWQHGPDWQPYTPGGDRWFGLEAVRKLEGIEEDLALIPLIGHSRGHSGLAVPDGDGWLLHAGDAFFKRVAIEDPPRATRGMRFFERADCFDDAARRANLRALRELHRDHRDDVRIVCSHDPLTLPQAPGQGHP